MTTLSRWSALGALVLTATLGAGCMTKPMRPANPDGTYCFAVGRWYQREFTCTSKPIPAVAVEEEAKRFEPTPELLTVYVIRKRWGDVINAVSLTVDAGAPVITTPESFVRLRLRPGAHKLGATWSEGTTALEINGSAGQVQFVELVGSVWSWGSSYRLEPGDPDEGRRRAARLRMVADLQ